MTLLAKIIPLYFAIWIPWAAAQFVPTSSAAQALSTPSPTESMGCRLVDAVWTCAAPRAPPSLASASALTLSSIMSAPTLSSAIALQAPSGSAGCSLHGDHYDCTGPAIGQKTGASVPPIPTESSGCILHGDHYHCDESGSSHTPSSTVAPASAPSPTESSNCFWHETHWDCFDTAEELEHAQASEERGECIIHVGHTHGDCTAEDLACGRLLLENYNMGLHIGSIFIVLVTSGLGVFLPLASYWLRKNGGPPATSSAILPYENGSKGLWAKIFFIARHFGTGVIISTAFIHLLYHGFVMFENECIGSLAFESTAPAIAMAAAFLTFLFDFLGSRRTHTDLAPGSPTESRSDDHEKQARSARSSTDDSGTAAEHHWQVLVLEAGIVFHSIMIGVTLGAGSGSGWSTLLIVIVFHQFFEGLALGVRIALLKCVSRSRSTAMCLVFMLITPIGIGIGIGVRRSFSQNGKASLLSVGIFNSISAGILLYTAFKVLSSDFNNGPLRHAPVPRIFVAFSALVVGIIAMSVLGKWA